MEQHGQVGSKHGPSSGFSESLNSFLVVTAGAGHRTAPGFKTVSDPDASVGVVVVASNDMLRGERLHLEFQFGESFLGVHRTYLRASFLMNATGQ